MRTNIKKLAAAILAAALILGNGTVVFADSAIAPATELKTETIRFADVADKAEESSPAVKAIRRSEKALREQDVTEEIEAQIKLYGGQKDLYAAQVTALANVMGQYTTLAAADPDNEAAWNAAADAAGMQLAAAQAMRDAMGDVADSLSADKMFTKMAANTGLDCTQLENARAEAVIIKGAEDCALGQLTLSEKLSSIRRAIEGMKRGIATSEVMVRHGLLDRLALEQQRCALTALEKQETDLSHALEQLQQQLAMLCGFGAGTRCVVTDMPVITEEDLKEMNYGDDLSAALDKNYDLQIAREKRSYADNFGTKYDEEAAAAAVIPARETAEASFRHIYLAVSEKAAAAELARAAVSLQQTQLTADKLRLDHGLISRNTYQDAQDALADRQTELSLALLDLYGAYNDYRWALKGLED